MAEAYKKHTHREHILSLPDTYVGSIETTSEIMYVVEGESFKEKMLVGFNPGFYKLFDEIVVNAHDQVVRMRQRASTNPVKNITIEISADNKTITVENDGEGIDVLEHPEYGVWVPQLIFGELLTSTNYDKEEKKLVGGKNGYGVKLANIFAKKMVVETVDSVRGKKYTQVWEDNMTVVNKPKIVASKGKSYVSVAWTPDFARFGLTDINADLVGVFRRRASDLAMTVGKDVKVHWKHGEEKTLIKCRDLTAYAGEFVTTPVAAHTSDRWNVVVADTPIDGFLQVSFVNGIWTSKGGTHVDYIVNQVVGNIVEYLETKKKLKVKPSLVKENIAVWVTAAIENPAFSSQTKEALTTKSTAFGSTCKLPEEFFKKLRSKLELVDKLVVAQKEKDEKENKKSDGRKSSKIYGIPKLDDAALAGTARSAECTLILTEGDSAKAMALSGLTKAQRQTFGVFPLRGKIMNVKDTSGSKIELAKEIAELKKIVGLESGKTYENLGSLRYGRILIMTDQDYDGSHIRGLLINLFHELWTELFKIPGFLTYMATPIVKATKGKETRVFYTQYDYDQWKTTAVASDGASSSGARGWAIQYYKGLGTSTREEAQEYFKEMNVTQFRYTADADSAAIDLAFNKARADDRKTWLQGHRAEDIVIPRADKTLAYAEFVNRDLIHFSHYNLERSIPSMMDGLKTSQRKILFGCLKRNLTSKVKVAQLAGYVSEHAGYHHGEMSLNETIIGMAQDFVGSNNLPWLVPKGQFGTRLQGGKDSAASRYIFTYLQPFMKDLVPADDLPCLKYRDDDGLSVEPEWYAPVLPMLLVNGARGIGTGYSTFIPSYNPVALKNTLLRWLKGEDKEILKKVDLPPWYRGFRGTIMPCTDGYEINGKYSYNAKTKTISVQDLPIEYWTSDFKEYLDSLCEKKDFVKDYTDTSTDMDVNFEIVLKDDMPIAEAAKKLGLISKIKTTNMHAFNSRGNITKYTTMNEILEEYAHTRLELYGVRKESMLRQLREKLPWHTSVVKFLTLMCNDVIDLRKKPHAECVKILETHELTDIPDLLKLPISSMTLENIAKHEAELARLRARIAEIEATTPSQFWIADLENLIV
jgi:DNA topoisomerase-2